MMSTHENHHVHPPALIIAGPTASGKSKLGVMLAERAGGEVVNADSMQIYRDLPIMTAAPSDAEKAAIPHHGYGVLDGSERCSVGRWLELTRQIVGDIHARGKLPILVGGTGMYIRAALEGISPIPDVPLSVRASAADQYDALGGAAYRQALAALDPVLADRLNDGDRQRLIRGMEVVMATGTPLSQWQDAPLEGAVDATFTTIRIAPPRDQLYAMCDRRLPIMLDQGGVEEVRQWLSREVDPDLPLMKAVGVPPIADFINGKISRNDAVDIACRDTRRYAKRQTTWFNNQFSDNFCEDSGYDAQFSESFIDKILSNVIFRA